MDLIIEHDTAASYGKTDQKYQNLSRNPNNREPRRNPVLMQEVDAAQIGHLKD